MIGIIHNGNDNDYEMKIKENENLWNQYPNTLRYLKKIIFNGSFVLDNNHFSSWFKSFGNSIQEIRLRNKDTNDTESPTEWIKYCNNLKILDIYGLNINKQFIK